MLPPIFFLCACRILMSKLCAAWHKVQSLTQHIHHRERDSAASAVEEEQSFVHSYLL